MHTLFIKLSVVYIIIYFQLNQMRFILSYKYGIFQKKTERIEITVCDRTDQIIQYLENKTQKKQQEFVLRYRIDKTTSYRIIRGWKVQHYDLSDGAELQLQAREQQSNDFKNKYQNKYLVNLLGQKNKQLGRINEQNQDEQYTKNKKQFSVRKYLDSQCQKLLKFIQKGNLNQIAKLLDELPDGIQEEYILEIQKLKPKLINQLGEGGWGPIHCAIYSNQIQILNQLIAKNVNLNKCTADGWLPIHLAINRKNIAIVRILLSLSQFNVNQSTINGTALHLACKLSDIEVMTLLLQKDADWKILDDKGKNCYEVCQKQQCMNLIKKYEQKRIQKQKSLKGFSQDLAIVKGVILTKTMFLTMTDRFLVLNPYEGTIIMYESEEYFPKKPKQIMALSQLKELKILRNQQKTWQMKKQLFYIQFSAPKKFSFALKNYKICQKWYISINIALNYQIYLDSHKGVLNLNDEEKEILMLDDFTNNIIVVPKTKKIQIKKQSPFIKKPTIILNSPTKKETTNTNNDDSSPTKKQATITNDDSLKSPKLYQKTSPQKNQNNYSRKVYQQPQSPIPPTLISTPSLKVISKQINQPVNQTKQIKSELTIKIKQKQNSAQRTKKQTKQISSELNLITNAKINFSSFEIIETLGQGSFGKVFLAKHIHTKKKYALKALKKKTLVVKKQLKYAVTEANVLKQANHPFIVNLHYAFQTPNYLYLALDYCSGKDLSFHLARQGQFPEYDAKFYIAELILAIEHLHEKNIIYRDLKPQNILLDQDGHIKLADFGLSKQNPEDATTKSFCGSPAYLSPQMLNQKGSVGKQADIYGIGCVLYQFLVGEPPFYNEDIPTLYQNIKEGKLKFPKSLSQQSKSLIISLLQRDPKKRIGSKTKDQLKCHDFFSEIDWIALQSRQIQAPQRQYNIKEDDDSDEEMELQKQNLNFTDYDYQDENKKINRLKGFSFVRTQ